MYTSEEAARAVGYGGMLLEGFLALLVVVAVVASIATLLSLAVGLWLAHLLANRRFRGKEVLDAAVALPLVLPPTVLGFYLLLALAALAAVLLVAVASWMGFRSGRASAPLQLDVDARLMKEAGGLEALESLIRTHNRQGGTLINLP